MADQIASLVVAVNSTSAKAAAADLDKLAASGHRAQAGTDKLAQASARAATSHHQVARAAQGYTKSAKELAFATRNLPAQFTDIAVSLQAGQNPMTVLLQQGGQLKDMFGSVGGAARAMGGYVKGLINVWSVGAVTIGGAVALLAAAEDRMSSLNKALITTGNYAQTTAEELLGVADSLDKIEGVTKGKAVDALTQLAATGKFTGEQLDIAGESALRMAAAGVASIEDMVDVYDKMAGDPVETLLELNEKEHFLTQAQIARVQALVDEGREQEAVTEALKIHARVTEDRMRDIRGSLGGVAGLWADIKQAISDSADQFVNWAGAADQALQDVADKMAILRMETSDYTKSQIDAMTTMMKFLGPAGNMAAHFINSGDAFSGVTTSADSTAEKSTPVDSEEYREQQKLAEETAKKIARWQEQDIQFLEGKARLETEILRMKDEAFTLGVKESEVRRREQQMRDDFARDEARRAKKPKKAGKTEEEKQAEAYARLSEATSERINLMNIELQGEDKLSGNRKAAEKLLHDLEKGYVNVNEAQAEKLRQDAEEIIRLDNLMTAQSRHNAMLEAAASIQERIAHEAASRAAQADMELLAIERGGTALELQQALKDVAFRADQDRFELRQEAAAQDMLHSAEYLQSLEDINAAEERALQFEINRIERRNAAQSDWRNGARRAMDEIEDEINDVAGQTRDGFVSAFNAMNQAVDEFARTGEVNMRRFTATVLAELAKIALRIMLSNALTAMFGGAGMGGGGSYAGSSIGTGPAMQGAAFAGGQRLHMMAGGIVTSPTLFPMANGGSVLAGEHDAEGILPLKRMSGGKLGVHAAGGGSGPITVITNVNIDNNGGTTSETTSNTSEEEGRQLAKMLEAKVKEVLNNERRQGGILWAMQHGR